MNFVVLPIYFLSGALFPLTGLPTVLNFLTRIDPLTYGVDGLRSVLLGSSQFAPELSLAVLAAAALVFVAFGSYSFSKIEI
jgi:ABC-2 type transport system permease protein